MGIKPFNYIIDYVFNVYNFYICVYKLAKHEFKRFHALKDAPLAKFGFQTESLEIKY